MLQGEHSLLLLTFIQLPFSIKTFVLSIFKCSLKTGFTVCEMLWYVIMYKFAPRSIWDQIYHELCHIPVNFISLLFNPKLSIFLFQPALIIQVLSWLFLPVYISAGVRLSVVNLMYCMIVLL